MPLPLVQNSEVRSAIDLLQAWIEAQMEYRQLPGLSIAIVSDREVLWSKGFGIADPETATAANPDTIYRNRSISKRHARHRIFAVADRADVSTMVDRYACFKVRNRFKNPPITIPHLLTHTSGVPRSPDFPYGPISNVPTAKDDRGVPRRRRPSHPKTQWKYSNWLRLGE